MAILCESYKLLFIMTPRTACSAIGQVLINELDGHFFPKEDVFDATGKRTVRHKHCTLNDLIANNLISETELSSLFVFAGVRNPFDSLASLYIKKRTKYKSLPSDPNSWVHKQPGYLDDLIFCQNHSFDEWIYKNYATPLFKKILGKGRKSLFAPYTYRTNAIIKFENLQDDFQTALTQFDIEREIPIPRFNTTPKKKNYRDYYSKESRKLIEYVFQKDLERFGYTF